MPITISGPRPAHDRFGYRALDQAEFYPDAVLRLEKVIDDGAYDLRLIPSGGQPHLQGFVPLRGADRGIVIEERRGKRLDLMRRLLKEVSHSPAAAHIRPSQR